MAKTKKTVLEWLSFIRTEEKKLNKKREIFEKSAFLVKIKDENLSLDEKEVDSMFKSMTDIEKNILAVKSALTVYNAKTTVKVGEKEYPIAHAIHLYKNGETDELKMFSRLYNRLISAKALKENESNRKREQLEKDFLNKPNSTLKDKEYMIAKKEELLVAVIDPVGIEKRYQELTEEHEDFMEKINTQINLKNSQSELEIDLV